MKVGDIVKLKNCNRKGADKRRWRVLSLHDGVVSVRRLDTSAHRLDEKPIDALTPISFWEWIRRK